MTSLSQYNFPNYLKPQQHQKFHFSEINQISITSKLLLTLPQSFITFLYLFLHEYLDLILIHFHLNQKLRENRVKNTKKPKLLSYINFLILVLLIYAPHLKIFLKMQLLLISYIKLLYLLNLVHLFFFLSVPKHFL